MNFWSVKNQFNVVIALLWIDTVNTIIFQSSSEDGLLNISPQKAKILKVSLSQKGYIQFLKYNITVPEISDYTFCIWIRSNNLTYSHALLSYSKNEEERLIRVWIAPHGTSFNFELFGIPITAVPTNLLANRFYHICQSWDSHLAAWAFYLDGKLYKMGEFPQMKNLLIPSKGDLVVGQEYTVFDKGLDDGIDGDISGFNMVLSSTLRNNKNYVVTKRGFHHELIKSLKDRPWKTVEDYTKPPTPNFEGTAVYSYNNENNLQRKSSNINNLQRRSSYKNNLQRRNSNQNGFQKRISFSEAYKTPVGLILVKLSNDCTYLKGAPLSGKGVLVHWTKTPVRVFGGAVLSTVSSFCSKTS